MNLLLNVLAPLHQSYVGLLSEYISLKNKFVSSIMSRVEHCKNVCKQPFTFLTPKTVETLNHFAHEALKNRDNISFDGLTSLNVPLLFGKPTGLPQDHNSNTPAYALLRPFFESLFLQCKF